MAKAPTGTASVITTAETTIAVTDHGGSGPTLVLTHGFGGKQAALRKLVPLLVPHFHVVTYDLRGHGISGNAPWSFDAAVRDLEAVVAWTGDPGAAVGGHSLGGMVAAFYAQQHPECRGAINIDGWGPGQPDQYVGIDPVEGAKFAAMAETGELSSGVARVVLKLANLTVSKDQKASREGVMPSLKGQRFSEVHLKAVCPSLAFNAYADPKGMQAKIMGDVGCRVLVGYRKGIAAELAAVSAANPLVSVHSMGEADHGLILSHPQQTAQAIIDFLNRSKDAA